MPGRDGGAVEGSGISTGGSPRHTEKTEGGVPGRDETKGNGTHDGEGVEWIDSRRLLDRVPFEKSEGKAGVNLTNKTL